MFNFSANRMTLLSSQERGKYYLYIMQDLDTKRTYRVFDFEKTHKFIRDRVYCISGKINSADQLYLVLEHSKEDIKYYQSAI